MKLLSRQIFITKTYDEVYQILSSSAYYFPHAKFFKESFSMHCAQRYKGGILSLIPIKGEIIQHDHLTEVRISTCADFGFYLGCLLILFGTFGLCWCISLRSGRWIPCVGTVLIGLLVSGQSIWEGTSLLDRLEHKLTR